MYGRITPPITSSLLAVLVKYSSVLYHAVFPDVPASSRPQYPSSSSSPSKAGESSSSGRRLAVPNLLESWPWPELRNPSFTDALNDEELAYFYALPEVQNSKVLQTIVKKGFVPLLIALIFPRVTEDQLRVVIRFCQWAVITDDHTEQDDIVDVERRIQGAIRTCLHPETVEPNDDEVLRELCITLRPMFSSSKTYDQWVDAVTNSFLPSILKQAKQHHSATIPTVEEWLQLRYDTFALDIFLPFLEFEKPINEKARSTLKSFSRIAGRMLFLENDLYSFKKEQASGDYHNTLVIVMHNLGADLDGAVHWVKTEHTRLMQTFLDTLRDLPSFGSKETDDRVREWVGDMGVMLRGYVAYCFEAPRYFGKQGALAKERGWVELVSPVTPTFDISLLDPSVASPAGASSDIDVRENSISLLESSQVGLVSAN